MTELDDKRHQRTIREEHIRNVSEPKSKYFDHVTPGSGKANDIASEILSLLNKRSVDTKQIVAIGCDSTAVNIGIKEGVVRLLEKSFKKPIQWFICLLHINELPLRHLFGYLIGPTTGPRAFSGAIGKALQTCDKNPVVRFEPIESPEPLRPIDVDDLSTDQNYLYEICLAVTSGQFHDDLANKYPGNICHSRLCHTVFDFDQPCFEAVLYASVSTPSDNLKTLADFIINVYALTWFDIKCQPKCAHGPLHLWNMIRRMQHLSETLRKEVLESVVKRGAYYAHQENVLIAMINNDNMAIRELGFRRILKARRESEETPRNSSTFGNLMYQKSILRLSTILDFFTWEHDHQRTEPPITMAISKEELCACIKDEKKLDEKLFDFPFHTQAVERCIKLVTEASCKCMEKRAEMVLFEQQLNRAGKCHDLCQRKT